MISAFLWWHLQTTKRGMRWHWANFAPKSVCVLLMLNSSSSKDLNSSDYKRVWTPNLCHEIAVTYPHDSVEEVMTLASKVCSSNRIVLINLRAMDHQSQKPSSKLKYINRTCFVYQIVQNLILLFNQKWLLQWINYCQHLIREWNWSVGYANNIQAMKKLLLVLKFYLWLFHRSLCFIV